MIAPEDYAEEALRYRIQARTFCSVYGHDYVEPEVVDLAGWEERIRAIRVAQERFGFTIIGPSKRYLQTEPGTVAHTGRLERAALRELRRRDCLPFCQTVIAPYVYHKGASFAPAGRKWAVSVFFLFRLNQKPPPPTVTFDLFTGRGHVAPIPFPFPVGYVVSSDYPKLAADLGVPRDLIVLNPDGTAPTNFDDPIPSCGEE